MESSLGMNKVVREADRKKGNDREHWHNTRAVRCLVHKRRIIEEKSLENSGIGSFNAAGSFGKCFFKSIKRIKTPQNKYGHFTST